MATKLWLGNATGYEGDWSYADNWSPSGVPASSDDVFIENSTRNVSAGLDQSAAALASLNISHSYTGLVGTASAYLQIGAAKVNIGYYNGPSSPAGSGRIKLDLGSATASEVIIENSGYSSDGDVPTIRLKAANVNTNIKIIKGTVGIAFAFGETSTVGNIIMAYKSSVGSDVELYLGAGVTMTKLEQLGGIAIAGCGMTTLDLSGGTLTTQGGGAITTANVKGGTATLNSAGTITTLNITGGTADFVKSLLARTITTLKLDPGGVLKYNPSVLTITNKVDSTKPVILTASAA